MPQMSSVVQKMRIRFCVLTGARTHKWHFPRSLSEPQRPFVIHSVCISYISKQLLLGGRKRCMVNLYIKWSSMPFIFPVTINASSFIAVE